MPQNADEPTVNDELDPETLETDPLDAEAQAQGDAADPNPPVAPPAQPTQQQPPRQVAPVYQPPERIVRARQGIAALDDNLGANGQLKENLTAVFDYQEELARENAALRVQVAQQGDSLNGIGFWQDYEADPKNETYPAAEARADLLKIKQEVQADPYYAGFDENTRKIAQQIATRERFFTNAEKRRTAAEPNNTTETTNAPTPAPQTTTQQVRTVGRTRVVPRSTQNVAPPPPHRMTVEEMILQNKLPPDIEKRLEQEFKEMAGRSQ